MVAGTLVNLTFSTKCCLLRKHRETIGFDTTVTAAFANRLIDHNTTIGFTYFSFLTTASFFCSTGLLIHNNGGSLERSELQHQRFVLVTMRQAKAGYSVKFPNPLFRGIGDQRDTSDALAA